MSRSRKWLGLLVGAGTVAAVVTLHRASELARADPALCVSCHAEVTGIVDGVAEAHPDVGCERCHPTGGNTVLWLRYHSETLVGEARTDPDNVASHGAVPDAACRDCHTETDGRWGNVAATAGHASHFGLDEPIHCADCHREAAHAGRPGNDGCVECHEEVTMASSPMAKVHCNGCHEFITPVAEAGRRPAWAECDTCHGVTGSATLSIQLHAEMPCATCHRPHKEPFTVSRNCEDCHDQVEHAHPEVDDLPYCTSCHGPHDEWAIAPERCVVCHESQALEAIGGVADAAPIFLDDVLLVALAELAAHATCVDCHAAHERDDVMGSKACVDCHDEVPPPPQHDENACRECHTPHQPMPRGCEACHDDQRVAHADAECADCHGVHENTEPPPCRECHRDVGSRRADAHPETACVGCHAPHMPEPIACDECHHEEVVQTRSKPVEHSKCGECHVPHEWKGAKTDCKRCHEEQAKATEPLDDHRDCLKCHDSHLLDVSVPKGCIECHKAEYRGAHKEHRACGECHDPHAGTRTEGAACERCHEEQAAPPPEWPAHTECDKCHEVHLAPGVGPPPCIECHDDAQRGSIESNLHADEEHAECDECHKSHGVTDASRANCLRCHDDQEDHEPDAPVCTGCHNFLLQIDGAPAKPAAKP